MDATIKRFEFTYELMWKTLKIFLEDPHVIRIVSPRLVFKEAYAFSILEQEDLFPEMIKSRNLLSHTYNEEQASTIYKQCPGYLSAVKGLYKHLSKE